jgi:hypothetical protein
MTSYVNPYTGQTISPSQTGYVSIAITSASVQLYWPINGNSGNVIANIIDVTTTSTAYGLILPAAEAASVGQTFLVNNKGSIAVTIFAQDGITSIGVVPTSVALYFWLTDNTTLNGTWEEVTFGAGTSAANATSLTGYGLSSSGSTLSTTTVVNQVSASYSFRAADQSSLYVWTGGVGNLTLPTATSVGSGWYVAIKNDGTGTVTVLASGSNTIDNIGSSFSIQPSNSAVFCSNGINWYTYGFGQASQFAFTQLAVTGTGGTLTLTSAQAANVIQEYGGNLTSNWTIVLPPTVQLYSLRNNTTGSFTVTFTTGVSGGTALTLPQNSTIIAICDGTNVYNSQTSSTNVFSNIQLGSGSASSPSLQFQSDNQTGIYLIGTGQLGFAISGVAVGNLTSAGLQMTAGINGGAF